MQQADKQAVGESYGFPKVVWRREDWGNICVEQLLAFLKDTRHPEFQELHNAKKLLSEMRPKHPRPGHKC